jgi:hypothetical protein
MEWQPIETAPRDGTVVDLWCKDGFRMTDQWWDDSDGDACWVCLFDDRMFTHWKPITEPDGSPVSHDHAVNSL